MGPLPPDVEELEPMCESLGLLSAMPRVKSAACEGGPGWAVADDCDVGIAR